RGKRLSSMPLLGTSKPSRRRPSADSPAPFCEGVRERSSALGNGNGGIRQRRLREPSESRAPSSAQPLRRGLSEGDEDGNKSEEDAGGVHGRSQARGARSLAQGGERVSQSRRQSHGVPRRDTDQRQTANSRVPAAR